MQNGGSMKAKKNVAGFVWELVSPVADALGYSIWDVEYVKEGSTMILRITIDTDNEEGITIDDCEKMHRAIDPVIDEADPIEESYNLEVSSPGVERLLTRPEHFERMTGAEVEVRLFAALPDRPAIGAAKVFTGILKGLDEGNIIVEVAGEDVLIPKKAASKVQTVFNWD